MGIKDFFAERPLQDGDVEVITEAAQRAAHPDGVIVQTMPLGVGIEVRIIDLATRDDYDRMHRRSEAIVAAVRVVGFDACKTYASHSRWADVHVSERLAAHPDER